MRSQSSWYNPAVQSFRAFRIFNENGKVRGRLVDATLDELTAGEVVIKAEYSSVNYKDVRTYLATAYS
jgi:NADPH:quinone reductase-like Zn-dependent oxidoreductase